MSGSKVLREGDNIVLVHTNLVNPHVRVTGRGTATGLAGLAAPPSPEKAPVLLPPGENKPLQALVKGFEQKRKREGEEVGGEHKRMKGIGLQQGNWRDSLRKYEGAPLSSIFKVEEGLGVGGRENGGKGKEGQKKKSEGRREGILAYMIRGRDSSGGKELRVGPGGEERRLGKESSEKAESQQKGGRGELRPSRGGARRGRGGGKSVRGEGGPRTPKKF